MNLRVEQIQNTKIISQLFAFKILVCIDKAIL